MLDNGYQLFIPFGCRRQPRYYVMCTIYLQIGALNGTRMGIFHQTTFISAIHDIFWHIIVGINLRDDIRYMQVNVDSADNSATYKTNNCYGNCIINEAKSNVQQYMIRLCIVEGTMAMSIYWSAHVCRFVGKQILTPINTNIFSI